MKKIFAVVVCFLMVAMASHAADLLPLVPADTTFIMNIDLAKFMKLPDVAKQIQEGIEKSKKQPPAEKGKKNYSYEEFVKASGFDPIKDVENVVIYVPAAAAKDNKPEPGVLIGGKFDEKKLTDFLAAEEDFKKDAKIEKFEGLTAIKSVAKEKEGLGVFLNPTTIALGKEDTLKKLIGVKKGEGIEKSPLNALLAKANKSALMWGVGQLADDVKAKIAQNPQYVAFSHVNSIFFSFDYGTDIDLNLTFDADKKENLDQLNQGVVGIVGMFKMFPGIPPEAVELLNLISVKADGTSVAVNWKVAKAKLDEFKDKMKKKMEQSGGMQLPGPGSDMPAPVDAGSDEGSASE